MSNKLAILLDASGSMMNSEERVVTGINKLVETTEGDPDITLVMFDSDRWIEFFNGPRDSWKKMSISDYVPESMTPLYDSIHKIITLTKQAAKKKDKVVIVIDTDGQENYSKIHSLENIKTLIEKRQSKGWEFIFLGTGLDEASAGRVSLQGAKMGVNTVAQSTHRNRGETYTVVGSTVSNFYKTGNMTDVQEELDNSKTS